jgi:hypothetical protein
LNSPPSSEIHSTAASLGSDEPVRRTNKCREFPLTQGVPSVNNEDVLMEVTTGSSMLSQQTEAQEKAVLSTVGDIEGSVEATIKGTAQSSHL